MEVNIDTVRSFADDAKRLAAKNDEEFEARTKTERLVSELNAYALMMFEERIMGGGRGGQYGYMNYDRAIGFAITLRQFAASHDLSDDFEARTYHIAALLQKYAKKLVDHEILNPPKSTCLMRLV